MWWTSYTSWQLTTVSVWSRHGRLNTQRWIRHASVATLTLSSGLYTHYTGTTLYHASPPLVVLSARYSLRSVMHLRWNWNWRKRCLAVDIKYAWLLAISACDCSNIASGFSGFLLILYFSANYRGSGKHAEFTLHSTLVTHTEPMDLNPVV